MKMAFILFDDMTTLDFSGFHNAVTWLKKLDIVEDLSWDLCSTHKEVKDDRGMIITVDKVTPDLSEYNLIFTPGGVATRQLIHDKPFVDWLQTAQEVQYKVSVCTGALLLGAAGFTKEKTITSNPLALDLVKPYCKEVVKARVLRDGDLFTGGGITCSVDLGLFFIESIYSKETAQEVQRYMDYPYYVSQGENHGDPSN
ncbi:thiamine biosynthesis protein ThiJ [Paenibacillus swuensis]|uniref:Thiamine biosynthesis protein ThiJ n=1 Tax=Paenibacillus swuensis TaxID=1178515 RepID=A0A172TFB4_9BACL|nr:DJ-1/PfpI family protein [Paenibacillus swuensis]ANE45594.1 thiamine biosynthesis protein ThiJ [Paenibacillus swuensis]